MLLQTAENSKSKYKDTHKIRPFSFGHYSSASSSEVSCWHINAGFAATFPSDRSLSLLPQRHPIAGTDLFGVLEKTSRTGDDPTDQSAANRIAEMLLLATCGAETNSTPSIILFYPPSQTYLSPEFPVFLDRG